MFLVFSREAATESAVPLGLVLSGTHGPRLRAGQQSFAAPRLTLLVVALLLVSCSAKKEEAAPEEHIVSVDVAPVLASPISQKVVADALLYPIQQWSSTPKISAPVKKFYVDRGAHVRAGQLLAELENRDLAGAVADSQGALDQAEANYQSVSRGSTVEELQKAESDVKSTKDTMDAQQRVLDSKQALNKEGALALKEVNDAQLAFNQAKSQYDLSVKHLTTVQSVSRDLEVKSAAAQRDSARGRADSAQAQLSYSRVTSQIDGVVTDRPIYAGETPSGGGPIITIMDFSQVVARAHVSQDDAKVLKVGDMANLQPTDGGAPVPGKVTLISPALDPTNTTVEVWVQAANPGGRLKPGTSLRVEMIAKTDPNALIIPFKAVLTSPSGTTSVMVVDAENKPRKKPVTLGIRDAGNVQITEGLQSGERVITIGAFELAKLDPDVRDKTKVQIQPPKETDDEDQ